MLNINEASASELASSWVNLRKDLTSTCPSVALRSRINSLKNSLPFNCRRSDAEIAKQYRIMAELTNLTDRLSHLRDRKGGSPVMQRGQTPETPKAKGKRKLPERKFATDYFMLFVYALLAVAMLTQLVLIGWLDFI